MFPTFFFLNIATFGGAIKAQVNLKPKIGESGEVITVIVRGDHMITFGGVMV